MHKLSLLHELQKQQLIGCQMSVAMATAKIRISPNLDSFYNISMLKYRYISSSGTSKGERVEVSPLHMIYNYVYSFSKQRIVYYYIEYPKKVLKLDGVECNSPFTPWIEPIVGLCMPKNAQHMNDTAFFYVKTSK